MRLSWEVGVCGPWAAMLCRGPWSRKDIHQFCIFFPPAMGSLGVHVHGWRAEGGEGRGNRVKGCPESNSQHMEGVMRALMKHWRGFWQSLCPRQPWQMKDFPICMLMRVPFGGRGRKEEGLGNFIRRWERREETPFPEQ